MLSYKFLGSKLGSSGDWLYLALSESSSRPVSYIWHSGNSSSSRSSTYSITSLRNYALDDRLMSPVLLEIGFMKALCFGGALGMLPFPLVGVGSIAPFLPRLPPSGGGVKGESTVVL